MKNLLIITLIAFSTALYGQNLVLNPSLEATQCPIFSPDPADYIAPWSAIEGNPAPDYYHASCGNSGTPNTTNNSVPFDGEGFAGLQVYGKNGSYYHRRYLQGELDEPLIKGRHYRITFYVKPVNINGQTFGINNIGIVFSDSLITAVGADSLLDAEPDIKANNAIVHTSYWTSVCGVFMAKGGEEYFTIGNFFSDEETNAVPLDPAGNPNSAYYLIDLVEVVENDYPELPKDTIICEQGRVDININRVDFKYLWQDGSTSGNYIITQPGEYIVRISSPACFYYDTLNVELVDCKDCKIYVPTAFTPNGDGKNETFQLKSTCEDKLVEYRLQVYDRWGQKVFESTDISVSWNGLDVDHLGTFTYNLVYTYNQLRRTKTETKQGFVTLIK